MLDFVVRPTLLAAMFALARAVCAAPDAASPDFEVTVQQGDTLTRLGQRWLADPRRWPEIQRRNKINNPNYLAPGSTLLIPVSLLREQPAEMTISSVSGRARHADGTPVASGERLREGIAIKTGKDGYVTVQLVDGSTLRLQSQSDLKLERSRRLPGSQATETQFQLPAGQAEVQFTPGAAKASRFEIRTGFASVAVHGTQFRVAASERNTKTEVTEGTIAFAGLPLNAVAAAAPQDSLPIQEGYGSIVDESRKPIAPVRLLAAPALPQEPVFQPAPALKIAFPPLEGAVSYRARLAADADFAQVVGEAVVTQPEVGFSGLKQGSYVLKVRAIDKFGLEGLDAIAVIGMLPETATTAPTSAAATFPSSPAKAP